MAILGYVEWLGQSLVPSIAGCAAIGIAALAGRALAARDTGSARLRPIPIRARRR